MESWKYRRPVLPQVKTLIALLWCNLDSATSFALHFLPALTSSLPPLGHYFFKGIPAATAACCAIYRAQYCLDSWGSSQILKWLLVFRSKISTVKLDFIDQKWPQGPGKNSMPAHPCFRVAWQARPIHCSQPSFQFWRSIGWKLCLSAWC